MPEYSGIYAGMMELEDMRDLGSRASACGFKSHYPYHRRRYKMKKFYIADMHFSHYNIIAFDNRPYNSIREMNQYLINNWNNVVSNEDIVYVLGDMFWCKQDESIEILNQLKGQKFLIRGNHDKCNSSQFIKKFAKVTDYLEVDDNGRKVVLCHYPIPCFKNHYYNWYHLYGHVHNSFEWGMMENIKRQMKELYDKPCEMYNVGVMIPYMNYTPRTLDEIIQRCEQYAEDVRSF